MLSHRVHRIYFVLGAIILIASFIIGGNISYDMNGESYSRSVSSFGILLSCILFFSGTGHYMVRKEGSHKAMTHVQLWSTLAGTIWACLHVLSLRYDGFPDTGSTMDAMAGSFGLIGLGIMIYLLNMSILLLAKLLN